MTYAMPELGPPAASTTAAPAATGTAAIERNFPTAEFTHACPFEGFCLRHLTMKRYQDGERSTLIGVHHPVVILLDAATGVNGRRRARPLCIAPAEDAKVAILAPLSGRTHFSISVPAC
jgi:hypothetical protein